MDTAITAVSTGSNASAVRSDVASASWPISGGPQTKPAHPKADTSATAMPGLMPATRPAALNRGRPVHCQGNNEDHRGDSRMLCEGAAADWAAV